MEEQIACPQPKELQEKFLRIGWGEWVPTPGVTDEDKEVYITFEGQHMYAMSAEEALALSDDQLSRAMDDVIDAHRGTAIAEYEKRRVK